jgi:hypothetical protein
LACYQRFARQHSEGLSHWILCQAQLIGCFPNGTGSELKKIIFAALLVTPLIGNTESNDAMTQCSTLAQLVESMANARDQGLSLSEAIKNVNETYTGNRRNHMLNAVAEMYKYPTFSAKVIAADDLSSCLNHAR